MTHDMTRDETIEPANPPEPAAQAAHPTSALAALRPPKALLFDLDGTLVDTVALRVEAWRRAFAEIGLDVAPESLGQYMGSDGRWLAGEVARKHGRELSPEQRDQLDQASGKAFSDLNRDPRPLPGATELLTALEKTQRLSFAIATSSQPGQTQASVTALRLPSGPPISDGSHVKHAKPEPDLLIESARQIDVPATDCWYVGDSKWDMMASVRADMVSVGVTTGATPAETLVEAGAAVALPGLVPLLDELKRRGLLD